MADAELAASLKKLTSTKKKDHVHPGQLTYVHWINSVNDSKNIIKQHGLIPEIKNDDDLKKMFPPMSHIYDYWETKTCEVAKERCIAVAEHFYSKLTTTSKRTLQRHAFYKERSSLLIHHKLMHGYALRTLKPANLKTPFLAAGIYIGCKAKPQDSRNSLRYKKGDGPENEILVDSFHLFGLASNNAYLSPRSSAAHLFKTKSGANTQDNRQKKNIQRIISNWKEDNPDEMYVPMPVAVDKPAKKATAGHDPEEVENSEDEHSKENSKALTKAKFKKPMGELGRALENLRKEHAKINQQYMLADVLKSYNAVQEMVVHGKLFDRTAYEQEEDEYGDDYTRGQEEDDEDWKASHSGDGSESDSEDSRSSEYKTGSSSSSEDDATSASDIQRTNDDGKNSIAGEEIAEANDHDAGDKDIQSNDGTGDPSNETPGNDATKPDDDVDEANKKDALETLYAYVDTLEKKVEKAGMKAKEIEQALCLKRTPDFRKPAEKACFCSLRSNDMQLIKKLYDDGPQEIEEELAEKPWIKKMVDLMLKLHWESSISELPQGSPYNKDDEIFLWKEEVSESFM